MNFSVLGSKPALQVFNQKRPDPIDTEQVDRKENNCYQSNDRRVLNFVRGRPRNSPHFRARVAQELRGALDKSGARSCQSALAPDSPALCPLAKCGRSWTRRADWFFHRSIACCGRLAEATQFVFVFVLQPANFFPALLAGVPGFEPGLSVLETDVLTVDTIPLWSPDTAIGRKGGAEQSRIVAVSPCLPFSASVLHFVSLWSVCLRQRRQNLLNSRRSVVVFLFLVVT